MVVGVPKVIIMESFNVSKNVNWEVTSALFYRLRVNDRIDLELMEDNDF